jgi:hypothetical protein
MQCSRAMGCLPHCTLTGATLQNRLSNSEWFQLPSCNRATMLLQGGVQSHTDWRNMILHEKDSVRFTMVRPPEGPWYQVVELRPSEQADCVHYDGNNRKEAETIFKKLTGVRKLEAAMK